MTHSSDDDDDDDCSPETTENKKIKKKVHQPYTFERPMNVYFLYV